jgi:hypothetical protein
VQIYPYYSKKMLGQGLLTTPTAFSVIPVSSGIVTSFTVEFNPYPASVLARICNHGPNIIISSLHACVHWRLSMCVALGLSATG